MSGVILRCPKCGTTQSQTGECDACYEDQVRYFCSSHHPGLWLDSPICNVCGAKFGEAPKRPPRVPPAVTPRPASTRPTRAPPIPAPELRDDEAPRIGRSPRPDPEVAPGITLADLLARALAARRARGHRGDDVLGPALDIGDASPRNRGCLPKAFLLIVLLLAIILGGPFVLLSGFLQYFF